MAISRRRVLLSLRCLSARAFFIAAFRSSSDNPAQRFLPIALAALEISLSLAMNLFVSVRRVGF
jgi:hypothetical protein